MDKKPQYIAVNTGKKKKIILTNTSKKTEDDSEYPESLKQYVAHSFANVLPQKKKELESQLQKIIAQATRTNMLDIIDWNNRDLPTACEDTSNPNSVKLIHKKSATIVSKLGNIELTPAEEKKRQMRAMRFQTDIPLKDVVTPAQTAAKKKKKFIPIVWDNEVAEIKNTTIIGTSTALEKPYFRLTSAADPATVRPLSILKKAFKMLKIKWTGESNYSYICEQFKSMRQDLTVQRIRNEFTVRVYETHARIALEKGDIGEYNQCQTQLKYLYEQGIEGCSDEFLAYRILYMLFSQNQSDINAMLEEMCDVGLNNHADCVQHALMIRSSLAKGNYHKFFQLYVNVPNMGGYLLDQFVDKVRVKALIIICEAYKMGISLSYIQSELSFGSLKLLVKFLREHGVPQTIRRDIENMLNTKLALPMLRAQSKTYKKVDIKGQI